MHDLGLKGRNSKLSIQWLNDEVITEDTKIVDCEIQGTTDGCSQMMLKKVQSWINLNLPCQTVNNMRELFSTYPQLKGLPLQSFTNVKPRLLIRLDNARLGLAKSRVDCNSSGPIAVETALGWILYGPVLVKPNNSERVFLVKFEQNLKREYDELNDMVKSYYEIENFGVKPAKMMQSTEDKRDEQILKNTTVHLDNFYERGLLWKNDRVSNARYLFNGFESFAAPIKKNKS